MNKDLPLSKSHNSVLFDFDSIVDLRFGFIRYLRNLYKDYPRNDESSFVDMGYLLDTPLKTLLYERVYKGDECLINCFADFYKDKALDLERSTLYDKNASIEDILKLSPTTSMIDLISKYKSMADGAVKTFIYCSTEERYNYAIKKLNLNKNSAVLIDKPDPKKYARFIVPNYRYIPDSPDMLFKSIIVLNYAENFTSNLEYGILNKEFVRQHKTCELGVMSAYANLASPMG